MSQTEKPKSLLPNMEHRNDALKPASPIKEFFTSQRTFITRRR